ncbi:MAG TPA: peptide-binding protein [Planctomycetaceae bacterium]|nr:peptide-binding protein [Planctomycetaceae bacterium]
MQTVTLRVISGADRGRIYRELPTPITIGREEGNSVQLNDERISRYHVKIQEDGGRLVVTDLESTNGTRINGNVCNLKILRFGDTISLGRTVLLVGSREQIAAWFDNTGESDRTADEDDMPLDSDDDHPEEDSVQRYPDSVGLPTNRIALPGGLTPGQAAELRELLDHVHDGLQTILDDAAVDEKENTAAINLKAWQTLLRTQSEIAEWIHRIEDPESE